MATLEERMKNGDFTVIGITHSNEYDFKNIVSLLKVSLSSVLQKNLMLSGTGSSWNDTREEHKQVPVKMEHIYIVTHFIDW